MKRNYVQAGAIIAAAMFLAPNMSLASVASGISLTVPAMQTAPLPATKSTVGTFEQAKRGRGRGRGGDRDRSDKDDRRSDRSDDRRDDKGGNRVRSSDRSDDRSSGRSRPRIPGGSGCDDPGDVAEHAECRGGSPRSPAASLGSASSSGSNGHGGRPRIPGGSGCDDPMDLIQYPECNL